MHRMARWAMNSNVTAFRLTRFGCVTALLSSYNLYECLSNIKLSQAHRLQVVRW